MAETTTRKKRGRPRKAITTPEQRVAVDVEKLIAEEKAQHQAPVEVAAPVDDLGPVVPRVNVAVQDARGRRTLAKPKNPDNKVFMARNDPKEIQRLKQKGYIIADERYLADGHSGVKNESGEIQFGDRIAMVCANADYEERRRYDRMLGSEQDRQLQESAEDDARDGYEGGGFYEAPEHGETRGRMFNIPIDLKS